MLTIQANSQHHTGSGYQRPNIPGVCHGSFNSPGRRVIGNFVGEVGAIQIDIQDFILKIVGNYITEVITSLLCVQATLLSGCVLGTIHIYIMLLHNYTLSIYEVREVISPMILLWGTSFSFTYFLVLICTSRILSILYELDN